MGARPPAPTGEEQAVAKLASHLHREVRKAQASLRSGLAEATAVLEDLRAERKRRRSDECFDPGHRRYQEALKLTDVVRRAGETLKDLAPEIRDHDRRIAAWRHNGKPLPCCRVSGWNDARYSNPYFELGPDCATVLNRGPSLAIAARRSEISYPLW